MKKKVAAGIAILTFLLIAGGLAALNFKKSALVSPLESGLTPTPAVSLLTWTDPAGFKFDYPAAIKIDNHPEDKISYANLELTADDHQGQIKISMVDSSFKTLGDWQKTLLLAVTDAAKTKLGNQLATRLNGDSNSPLVAAIDGNALVSIQGSFFEESQYWRPIYDQILASFEFIPLASEPTKAPAKSGSSAGTGGVIDEGEEIVE